MLRPNGGLLRIKYGEESILILQCCLALRDHFDGGPFLDPCRFFTRSTFKKMKKMKKVV